MNTKKRTEIIIIWISMILLFSSCAPAPLGDGMIDMIQPQTTLWVIERNIGLHSGTIRMAKDSYILAAAWIDSAKAWGYVFLDLSKEHPLDYWSVSCASGNCANPRTMSDLVTSLLNNGWKIIDVLPPCLVAAYKDSISWLRLMPSLPVLIIPAGVMDIPGQILPPAGGVE